MAELDPRLLRAAELDDDELREYRECGVTGDELVELLARAAYAREVCDYQDWFWEQFRETDPDGHPRWSRVHPDNKRRFLDRARFQLEVLALAGREVT